MLLFVGITIIILTCCLTLHYKKHFKCQCCRPKSNAISRLTINTPNTCSPPEDTNNRRNTQTARSRMNSIAHHHQSKYRCIFTSADTEDFDFFPVAFFFYLLILIFICILIVVKCFIVDAYRMDDEFGHYFINSYHEHFESLTSHDETSIFGTKHNIQMIDIIDWILIYSIMIVAIWESLFSFYRFYTTLYSATKYYRPSTSSVVKKFTVYALIFIIAFIIEIHVTYWMFPIVVLLHSSFNVFCTLQFASLLIQKYRIFITMGSSDLNKKSDKDILKSVYFMRKTSLFCTLIQSLCLSLFAISYNIDIIYYLPILWGISSVIFTLNFVRNRTYIIDLLYALFWSCRYGKCCIAIESYIQQKREKNRKIQRQASINLPNINANTLGIIPSNHSHLDKISALKMTTKLSKTHNKVDSNSQIQTDEAIDDIINVENIPTPQLISSPSVPVSVARASIIKLPPKHPNMQLSQSAKNLNNLTPGNASPSKKSKKAFAILGLHESTSGKSATMSPIKGPHKRSQTNFNFGNVMPITEEIKDKNNEIIEHRKLDLNSSSVPLPNESKKEKFKPDTFTINECDEKDNNDAIIVMSPINNDAKNTPLIIDYEAHSMPTPLIKISDDNEKGMNETIETEMIFGQDELFDNFVYMDEDLKMEENKNNKCNELQVTNNNGLKINVPKIKISQHSSSKSPIKQSPSKQSHSRKHTRNTTMSILSRIGIPITPSIDRSSIDLENVVQSLEILVEYGFCSRLSVNNIKQIKSYRDQYALDEIPESVNVNTNNHHMINHTPINIDQ